MPAAEPSVQEANKALVRRYLEELFHGDPDFLDEAISEDYIGTNGPNPPARYKARFSVVRRAFPDIRIRFDALIAEGDWVAVHCTIEGTHLGEWRGIPPTGKHATWTLTAFRRVRGGKLVQGHNSWDWLKALEQIGATVTLPSPAAPTPSEGRPPSV
jgi:predicted ester cyclase